MRPKRPRSADLHCGDLTCTALRVLLQAQLLALREQRDSLANHDRDVRVATGDVGRRRRRIVTGIYHMSSGEVRCAPGGSYS